MKLRVATTLRVGTRLRVVTNLASLLKLGSDASHHAQRSYEGQA